MRGPLGNPRSFKSFCTKHASQTGSDKDNSTILREVMQLTGTRGSWGWVG